MFKATYAAVLPLVAAIVFAAVSLSAAKENDRQGRASLAGIKGIGVVIEDLAPDAAQVGFSTQLVQADVGQKLRSAGIKVLSEDELLKTSGMPYLYINIFTFKDDEQFAYHITLELKQMAALVRKPGIKLSASTWKTRVGGTVGIKKVTELRAVVKDETDQFISAWKAANP
jgi:hypothetical protein